MYRLLDPGQEISARYNLVHCYAGLREPGAYRIVAEYKDGSPKAPPAPQGAVYLSEAVRAQSTVGLGGGGAVR
jgi:hypothetical protein